MALTSLRAYAKHRGISVVAVHRAIKRGRLRASVVRDGRGVPKIGDVDLADREWAANGLTHSADGADVCTAIPDPLWLESRRRASRLLRFDSEQCGRCQQCHLGPTVVAELSGVFWAECTTCRTCWPIGRTFEKLANNDELDFQDLTREEQDWIREFDDELMALWLRRLSRLRRVNVVQ